jgi:glycosyltransferase involved in cell wall biosynthesis
VSIGDKMLEMRRNQQLALLLVGSAAMREELIQNGFPRERVEILPPVVRMPLRAMAPIPEENRILYVGQLIRGKGVDLLLRALTHVRGDYELTIVGAGNARAGLDNLCAKLDLGRKVRFEGWVNPQDLGDYYARAKLVAAPSRWPEPFGMIGLEAMHYGRPVVAFRVGGIPDWLEHGVTGLMAPEQDVRAFAAALEQLLSDPQLCSQLGQQAQERVRTKFCFENYLDRLEGLMSV